MTDFKEPAISALHTMYLGSKAAGDHFKAKAYKTAIDALRAMEGPLTTITDFNAPKGVGAKIMKKLEEIIATGGLAAAERMKASTDVGSYEALTGVHGIGPVKAKELIATGIKTIADLRTAVAKDPKVLNDVQQIGLKYYEASLERIPRAELVLHEAMLMSLLPAKLTGTIVGSYRRGAVTSGDIDMLVSYDPSVSDKEAGKAFTALTTALAGSYTVEALASGTKKWMGFIRRGDATARRLDLLLTPPAEYAYAILYFTGSDKFNVAMRKYALTLGYSLSEHGIKVVSERAKPVPTMRDEKDIFAFLGLQYVAPTARVDGKQIVAVA